MTYYFMVEFTVKAENEQEAIEKAKLVSIDSLDLTAKLTGVSR